MLPRDEEALSDIEAARWALTKTAFALSYFSGIDADTIRRDVADGLAIADEWRLKDEQKAARLTGRIRPIREEE